MNLPRPILILGPTAGGKSELAVSIAESLRPHGEIINADSMQVYRHMDAGTAKPQASLRERVAHHLIDIVEPAERFTVADWLGRAEPLIGDLQARGVTPLIVGGTNLYMKALLVGMFEGPESDPVYRAELMLLPGVELHRRLQAVDPEAAQRIHPNDMKKMVRALEVFKLTGKPISAWQTQWREEGSGFGVQGSGEEKNGPGLESFSSPEPRTLNPEPSYRFNPILLGLAWPVEAINPRINARVKAMFHPHACGLASESLPDEVRRLDAAGILGPPDSQAREALGYKQVLDHFAGRCTLDEAFEKTKVLTRRFAKTQRTWLKRFKGVHWLSAHIQTESELAASARAFITTVQ